MYLQVLNQLPLIKWTWPFMWIISEFSIEPQARKNSESMKDFRRQDISNSRAKLTFKSITPNDSCPITCRLGFLFAGMGPFEPSQRVEYKFLMYFTFNSAINFTFFFLAIWNLNYLSFKLRAKGDKPATSQPATIQQVSLEIFVIPITLLVLYHDITNAMVKLKLV